MTNLQHCTEAKKTSILDISLFLFFFPKQYFNEKITPSKEQFLTNQTWHNFRSLLSRLLVTRANNYSRVSFQLINFNDRRKRKTKDIDTCLIYNPHRELRWFSLLQMSFLLMLRKRKMRKIEINATLIRTG